MSKDGDRRRKFSVWRLALTILAGFVAVLGLLILLLVLSPGARDWAATRLLTDRILKERLADIPPRTQAGSVSRTMVRMRDGTELSTQVFLPEGEGPWPVIIVRDPYSFAQYLGCKVFVRYDYACVYQEARGRGPSQGIWYPFVNEREDGLATIDWILEQPWQNGRLAFHGGSYLGVVQWTVAGDLPGEVKTLVPTVAHGELHSLSYRNGMFNQGVAGAWLYSQFQGFPGQLFAEKNWRKKVSEYFPARGVDPEEFGAAWTPYLDYISHPEWEDPYWQSPEYVAIREAHKKLNVPVLMIGFANDFFLPGMLRTYEELPARDRSVFIIGPGNHGGQKDPEIEGHYTLDYADTLAWYDHHLKGMPLPERLLPGVHVFVHGQNRWLHSERWPGTQDMTRYYLSGLAAAQACDGGQLDTMAPSTGQLATYAYDPRDPVPAKGGAFLLLSKAVEEQGNESCERDDVLSFASGAFPSGALINGAIRIRLQVASDAADTAFTVRLQEHFADGRVYNIRDDISSLALRNGATRRLDYQPGEEVEIQFDLTPIAWHLQPGSRLRLDISSSSAPAFFPHPNKAGLWSAVADPVIAHQTLFGGEVEIAFEPEM